MNEPVNLHLRQCPYSGKVRNASFGPWPQCCCHYLRIAVAEERERLATRYDELAHEAANPILVGALTEAYVNAAKVAREDPR